MLGSEEFRISRDVLNHSEDQWDEVEIS